MAVYKIKKDLKAAVKDFYGATTQRFKNSKKQKSYLTAIEPCITAAN